GLELLHLGVRQQRQVGILQRWVDADHLSVRLGIDQARKTVAGLTTDALARTGILLVELNSKWNVERLQPQPGEVIAQLLQPGLVADGRMRVGTAGARVGRIVSPPAVDLIQLLGLEVIRLQLRVGARQSRRNPSAVTQLPEIFLAQSKERGTIELGISSDVVVGVRVERLAVFVPPDLLGLIPPLAVDGAGVPVLPLPTHV